MLAAHFQLSFGACPADVVWRLNPGLTPGATNVTPYGVFGMYLHSAIKPRRGGIFVENRNAPNKAVQAIVSPWNAELPCTAICRGSIRIPISMANYYHICG